MRLFGKTHIDFMGKRRVWYTISASLIVIGLISLALRGVNYGIDFLGGTEMIVRFDNAAQIGELRDALAKGGFQKAEVKSYGSERDFLFRTMEQGAGTTIGDRMRETLKQNFPTNNFQVLKEDKIGPKIGAELRSKAFWAVFWSLIAISIYVSFRFKWIYGVGAVVALFHDVLIALGMVSIFDGLTPSFNLEITQDMIAAFLTLVGLSVNDTVVIFDRIRENQKIFKAMSLVDVINKSLNETLSRTIITSGTIFIVTLVMLSLGGEVLRGFSFVLTVGIITGTYSSIYIASAIVLEWSNRAKKQAKLID
jgi:preprotein translocase SecF subunit